MGSMRGILSWGGYLPYRRLDRTLISAVAGSGGGKGTRTVASYDEDTTTMGVDGGPVCAAAGAATGPRVVWFATTEPALPGQNQRDRRARGAPPSPAVAAYDAIGSVRSAMGVLKAGLDGASQPS